MADTTNLVITEITAKEVSGDATFNEAMWILDFHGQPRIENILTAQPSGVNGNAWIVGTSATGADWSGNDDKIAHYVNSEWRFYTPKTGWIVYNLANAHEYVWNGTSWRKLEVIPTYAEAHHEGTSTTQVLAAATVETIKGFTDTDISENGTMTLTTAENANDAVFDPNTTGKFECILMVSFLSSASGDYTFYVYNGTADTKIGTADLSTDTLGAGNFCGGIFISIGGSDTIEFRVECSSAATITYESLYVRIKRIDV